MYESSFHIQEHRLPTSHIREYPGATAGDQEDVLHLAIKQYTPKDSFEAETTVTVIGAHANGFPKELYEPLWDELYARLKAKKIAIRSIWIADVAYQGASGVLNEDLLGNDPSWMDHPRDLFLMVNHFRDQMKRPIIGIAHSMGGNNLVNLSLMHPRLFTSLILIDPVIQRRPSIKGNFGPARASAKRRDRWPSRAAAETAFRRNKFYQTWDPRVLDNWLRYGLRELPTALYSGTDSTPSSPQTASDREVTLTTTKHQEVLSFLRLNHRTTANPFPSYAPNPSSHPDVDPDLGPNNPFYRPEPISIFKRLRFLRPSVFYIFGDKSDLSAPLLQADKLAETGVGVGGSGGVKKGRVASTTFKGVGHLIPMEVVGQTADAVTDWLLPDLQRFHETEALYVRQRDAVAKDRRALLTEDYVRAINGDWANMVAEEEEAWRKSKL